MKTDWQQMNGKWIFSEDETPSFPGEYLVELSRSLKETTMKHDGQFWITNGSEDWPYRWFKQNINLPTEPICQ